MDDDTTFDESPYAAEARRLTREIVHLARAFATIASPDVFFCHVTAAALWGLPVPIRVLRPIVQSTGQRSSIVHSAGIDVGTLLPRRASRSAGVRGRELSPNLTSVRTIDGLRVSSPASTWAMLADVLTIDELVQVGDAIVRIPRRRGMERGTPADSLATIEQLTTAANAPRRRHADALRAALRLIRVGSASVAETKIRLDSVRAGLPEPELDFDVFARDGTPIGFTELAYPDFRQLIEYEGDHHRTDRTQWYRDIEKHTACFEAGYQVLRLTARHVYPSTAPAVEGIRAALRRAGWRG